MERADLSRPGANLSEPPAAGGPQEVERLHQAFRRMLERLEAERRRTSSAALAAQEEERARVARDLHDEVNQSLTGLLLRLEAAREKAPPSSLPSWPRPRRSPTRRCRSCSMLARQLRPTALDDLGLNAALAGAVRELDRQSDVSAGFEASGELGDLPGDVQLVVYRVAQEALSNAARHSDAGAVAVRLARRNGSVELEVADDGRGFSFDQASRGLGIAGMRERALLVNGKVEIDVAAGRRNPDSPQRADPDRRSRSEGGGSTCGS